MEKLPILRQGRQEIHKMNLEHLTVLKSKESAENKSKIKKTQ